MGTRWSNLQLFVGRKDQISEFQENLERLNDQQNDCLIFNISGQAGMGKTELLGQFYKRTIEEKLPSARTNFRPTETSIAGKYPIEMQILPAVMEQLAEQLEKRPSAFRQFHKRYQDFCRCLQKLDTSPKAIQWTQLLSQALVNSGMSAAQQFPFAELLLRGVDEESIAQVLGNWIDNSLSEPDDAQLMKEPLKILSPLFLKGLDRLCRNRCTALFFDDFEQYEHNWNTFSPDQWLQDLLLENRYGPRPKNLLVVIAGRRALNPFKWEKRNSSLFHMRLKSFTEIEVREFLSHCDLGNGSEALVRKILEYSEGIPLIVKILSKQALTDSGTIIDPCEGAVKHLLLDDVKDHQKAQLALSVSLSRYFNQDIVKAFDESNKAEIQFSWLTKRPFVFKTHSYWIYDSSVRNFMLRYLRQLDPPRYSKLHQNLASYYETRISSLELTYEQKFSSQTWWNYHLEWLYHSVCHAQQQFILSRLDNLLDDFVKAFRFQGLTANKWIGGIQQAGRENDNLELSKFGEILNKLVKHYQIELKEVTHSDRSKYPKIILLFGILVSQTLINIDNISALHERDIKHILKDIEDPKKVKLALMVALSRRFNSNVFGRVVNSNQAKILFDWLIQLPFVTQISTLPPIWQYHPLIRGFILRKLRYSDLENYYKLHASFASLYSKFVQKLDWNDAVSWSNRAYYRLEWLYHSLCVPSYKITNADFVLGEFAKALRFQYSRADEWANAIQQAGEDSANEKLKSWGEKLIKLIKYPKNQEKLNELEVLISSNELNHEKVEGYVIKWLRDYLHEVSQLEDLANSTQSSALSTNHKGTSADIISLMLAMNIIQKN